MSSVQIAHPSPPRFAPWYVHLVLVVLAAIPLFISGCASLRAPLPAPTASWETHTGQLFYRRPGGKSVIGDVLVRRSGSQEFVLNFSSGPGIPLLKLQISGDQATAEGVFARGRWSGRANAAPRPLRSWIALRDVFAELSKKQRRFAGAGWSGEARYTESQPEHVEIPFPGTGERFVFHFGR